MNRSIVMAMGLGLLVGAACKKSNDADKSAAKTQTAPAATAKDPGATAATATSSEGAGVAAGGIERGDEGAAAQVSVVAGTVEVRRLGETTWTAAKADTKLFAGDIVRTADASSATILLADQSVIEVAETSTVAVASRDGMADPASSAAVLAGMARFTVTPRTAGEGAFRVYTPSAVVLTTGTVYGVGVAASGEARVGVESGTVEILGVAALDAPPVNVASSTQVLVAADGKVGSTAAWATDDWGTWRDETDAKIELAATIDAHGAALNEMNAALVAGYAELQANADSAATFEANAAIAAEKNDQAAYTAALPEGAATIDASFSLAGRLEALTWAHAGHATLATELYVRHPAEVKTQWEVVAPRVDAAVLWPKRFEITATAYFQPLRTQYYVHHPVGRAHAELVGITVPTFYASVQPPAVEPMAVRAKLKGQIWMAPQMSYKPSTRHVWIAAPSADWSANAKLAVAPPRAKVAWYVRPATLKAKWFVGAPVSGSWTSALKVEAPQPRAALAASWKVPVGMKVKVNGPDMAAAAKARANAKFDAKGQLHGSMHGKAHGKMDTNVDTKINGKLDVKAPTVAIPAPPAIDVKAKADAASAGVKGKVDGAVKANANVKVKAPEVQIQAPSVKVEAKGKAGFKLGN